MNIPYGLKILIADDFLPIRERLSFLIKEAYDSVVIEEATNTDELIQKALAAEWDLVISDISMPGEGGIRALRRIKKLKPSLPVLVISTHAYTPYAKEMLSAGASGYLTKDDVPSCIIGVIEQIILKEFQQPV